MAAAQPGSMGSGPGAGYLNVKLERAYNLKDTDLLHKMVSEGVGVDCVQHCGVCQPESRVLSVHQMAPMHVLAAGPLLRADVRAHQAAVHSSQE